MCQLLGVNANQPISAAFSLGGFLLRGGATDHHADGWGIGYYREDQCRLLTDACAAAHSPRAGQAIAEAVRTPLLIAHVRKATQGSVAERNCHPFHRVLWGRDWLFAHNGDLKGDWPLIEGPYVPEGETDSERAFCGLLNRLEQVFGQQARDAAAVAEVLADWSDCMALHGPLNFLLSDGDHLFARCSTELHHVERAFPFRAARLIDSGLSIDFSRHNDANDRITVIATRPLTVDEHWTPFAPGELKVFRAGALVHACAAAAAGPAADSPGAYALG